MKPIPSRPIRRNHDLLREFFACAVVIAAIKSGNPTAAASAKSPTDPSPSGRI